MAAIHSLSDNLQGILVDLSEKIDKLQEKNIQLEERTKELESKEVETKAKIEELVTENFNLQERVIVLEKKMSAEAESELRALLEARDLEMEGRLAAAEVAVAAHDKLVARLESCEKKLASFYGEDTNILGRVGHLETRFKDFKKDEDTKLEQQRAGLSECQAQAGALGARVQALEMGVQEAHRACVALQEQKLDSASLAPLLSAFKEEERLADTEAVAVVAATAGKCQQQLEILAQLDLDRQELLQAALDKIRVDIETLQRNTEPAHKYECFGSDQAVKIFQLESRLAELQGLTTASLDARLDALGGRLDSNCSQMERVLGIEATITHNFDRIGTDYVHLSRLISDINEELSGLDHKMQQGMADAVAHMEPRGLSFAAVPVSSAAAAGVLEGRVEELARGVAAIERLISDADERMSAFAEECKDCVADVQASSDKKIDILAVWVSKNINLLAASTRKKFKQLLQGGADSALLAGQSRGGHCLSCNQTNGSTGRRPLSASLPRTRVVESKSPQFRITHVDQSQHPFSSGQDQQDEATLTAQYTEEGELPPFRMTVPSSLRMKVSSHRRREQQGEGEGEVEGEVEESLLDEADTHLEQDSRRPKSIPAARSLPRKFFRNPHS